MTRHPARFPDSILHEFDRLLPDGLVLDPFAGTGRIHELATTTRSIVGVEIEPEWAALHPSTVVGNALELPFADDSFDAIATSPAYGNRLADHHEARDGSVRRSYRHDLGRPLHPANAGGLQWGEGYRTFHRDAWIEAVRVLRPGGMFVLNIKDHVRAGRVVPVTAWHVGVLASWCGLTPIEVIEVPCAGMRYGANSQARTGVEYVIVFRAG